MKNKVALGTIVGTALLGFAYIGSQKRKTALIIKGNPKYLKYHPVLSEQFYKDIEQFLKSFGYEVFFDAGEPYTSPRDADLWIGHSRGVGRLRFAGPHTKTIAFGAPRHHSDEFIIVNHPDDDILMEEFDRKRSTLKGYFPTKEHYIFTDDMKNALIDLIKKGSASIDDFDDGNKGGDCYEAAGRWMMDNFGSNTDAVLVHGEVRGRGGLQDVWFGHAWIEQGDEVIEVASGKNVRMPKQVYYILGTIDQPYYQYGKMNPPKNNVLKYTKLQAMEKLAEFKTWGPWELETETGY